MNNQKSNMQQKHEFIYKNKTYQYDFRSAIYYSDYIYENLIFFLQNPKTELLENEEQTNFTEESINDFVLYLEKPDSQILKIENVVTLKKLGNKYKIRILQTESDDYISKHHIKLIFHEIKETNVLSQEHEKIISDNLIECIFNKQLLLLPVNFVDRILQSYRNEKQNQNENEEDKMEKETKIMNFFFEYIDLYGRIGSILFKYIDFTKVGAKFLAKILDDYSDVFAFIPNNIVKNLCEIYVNLSFNLKEFNPTKGDEFNGIMRYLTNKTGGNIHDNGTIEITSNSINNNNNIAYHPKNLVEYQNPSLIYHSNNTPGNLICFNFKNKSVQLTSYSIRSYNADKNGGGHWRNWVVEVSNNQINWIEVDSHIDDPVLNGPGCTAIFDIKYPKSSFYHFIRIRQTGISWHCYPDHNNYIFFPFIEFFGKLREP